MCPYYVYNLVRVSTCKIDYNVYMYTITRYSSNIPLPQCSPGPNPTCPTHPDPRPWGLGGTRRILCTHGLLRCFPRHSPNRRQRETVNRGCHVIPACDANKGTIVLCTYKGSLTVGLYWLISNPQLPKQSLLGGVLIWLLDTSPVYETCWLPREIPKPRYLSPAANSLSISIAGCRSRYLSLGTLAQLPIPCLSGLLVAALRTSA
jgi:hypothetical protein